MFATAIGLRDSSRIPNLSRTADISAVELACLATCGALAAAAVGFFHLSIQVPGHAILRGALPMSLGLALVPRRSAGTVMTIGAALGWVGMNAGLFGSFQAPAMLSVLALGPVMDIALIGEAKGWRLYARLIIAGVVANLLALALKSACVAFGIELGGGGQFRNFGMMTLLSSYILCGGLAGLLGAAACFRARVDR